MTDTSLPDEGDLTCRHDGGTHYDPDCTAGLCNLCGQPVFGCTALDVGSLTFAADALDGLSDDDRAEFLAALTDRPDTVGIVEGEARP